jgi:UDP-N-acetylglucosamine 2-epimerase (non-hydrolysing)/GDP/UDP-N,N'-diacetylbacillosamine 2-epimerase (hydrolysing)
MKRTVLAVTGSRAEYGAMRPVFEAIAASCLLDLELAVTGMHLAPQFGASLAEIEADRYGPLHRVPVYPADASPQAMARALGETEMAMTELIAQHRPEIVLVQGDRGEMLAAAAAAAHMNIAVVHMSGGDRTGSIDDSIRRAITSFAHVHLTTCEQSRERVLAMGEAAQRIFVVGEPNLDVILRLDPVPFDELAAELDLDPAQPFVLATQHPVTTEAERSGEQLRETLAALAALELPTVFTYPNTDAGYEAIVDTLESWQPRAHLRVAAHLGSRKYLSLMRRAALVLGNSSSGIIEAASFRVPVVNIGTRQHARTRACNVTDAGYDRDQIRAAIERALYDPEFRAGLPTCMNPYGDGHCAERTVAILQRLRLGAGLVAKWLPVRDSVLDP